VTEPKWLDGYSGQSAEELVALASEYRIDSIVLAFEQALQSIVGRELNEAERTVLVVEALEREVNNGGFHQFFLNTPEHAPCIVAALKRIDCPETADICETAISQLGLRQPFTAEHAQSALNADTEGSLIRVLSDRCDQLYYKACEPIADRLLEFIGTNSSSIRLGK
jgi:hypothetical protein